MPLDDRLRRRIEAIARFLCKPRKALSRMPLRIALSNVILCATIASAANYKVHQWQAVEIELTSSVTYADSFQDVAVTATFTTPDGRTITRPAFWDGGLTWKVRFAPPRTGLWTMTTSATDARNSGLNHVTRTVRCDPYSGNLAIYKHGFLKVSKNGRYLTYADGTPFFYLGDTHWILSHERFDTSNAPGVASQFKYTVDKRVKQGFTVFQSEAGWQARSAQIRITDEANVDEEADADFKHGFTSADLAGFANLDRKFKYVADKGLVHANAEIGWVGDPALFPIFTEAYMASLAKYWVARYGAYPVIWTIAQEIDKNNYGAYDATTIKKWFAAAQSIADNDAYHQPVMPHMENTDPDPIGRHIHIGSNDADAEIVGVAGDSRISDVREKPPRLLYVPFEQGGDPFTRQSAFFVRTQGDEGSLMTAIRATVRQLDRNLPIERLTSMKLMIDDSIYRDRLVATLAIAFGALAAILAAVGLYGTISYSVARRTREFGIRLVLGAAPESLLLFVMREVGWLIAIGVAVGVPASYLLARFAESQFYGVHAHDPWALAGATLLIAIVGLAAGLTPAVRAMRIEPLDALRYE